MKRTALLSVLCLLAGSWTGCQQGGGSDLKADSVPVLDTGMEEDSVCDTVMQVPEDEAANFHTVQLPEYEIVNPELGKWIDEVDARVRKGQLWVSFLNFREENGVRVEISKPDFYDHFPFDAEGVFYHKGKPVALMGRLADVPADCLRPTGRKVGCDVDDYMCMCYEIPMVLFYRDGGLHVPKDELINDLDVEPQFPDSRHRVPGAQQAGHPVPHLGQVYDDFTARRRRHEAEQADKDDLLELRQQAESLKVGGHS